MTSLSLRLCLVAALLGATALPARAESLAKLVDKADRIYRGDTSAGVFTMEIHTRSFDRHYDVVVWESSLHGSRTLVKILGPALWRGHGTLKRGDRLELYDPKSNHVTRVNHSMLGDSWMGSHFNNDDLIKETRLARDYDISLIDKKQQSSADLGDVTYYRLALTPRPTAPVAWGRIVYEIAQHGDVIVPRKASYYRKASDNRPARALTFTEVGSLAGRTLPRLITVTVASKPGEHTSIHYKKLKIGVKVPDDKFTEQALRK